MPSDGSPLAGHHHTLQEYLSNKQFLLAALSSLALLSAGIVLNVYANVYATESASNYVTDIILSNVRVFEVDILFVYGTYSLIFFVIGLWFTRPQWLPYCAASLGLFYLIRTCFVSLTHLGPFPDRIALDVSSLMEKIIGGGDMFFSGHTGAPFLLALIFWHIKWLRWIFLAASVAFAIIVLLGHMHYTIDVASAYFISFAIFHIGERYFGKFRRIFHEGLGAL